jgi:hypothetical protein
MTAEPVTLNAAPTFAEPGLDNETLLTFTSEEATMFVFEVFERVLLLDVGSSTWIWSIATVAFTEKLCADGFVQVTDHVAGEVGTVVATDVASDVFCTVVGFGEPVVQSLGSVNVRVVSTLVGP